MNEPLHSHAVSRRRRRAPARSFEDLVDAEKARLFGALCLITRDRYEAEDVMQEAFLKVWERWDRSGGMEDPTGYLYRTAMNLYRKRVRRASLALKRAMRLALRVDDELREVETRDVVVRALAALTPRQRQSIVLVDLPRLLIGGCGACDGDQGRHRPGPGLAGPSRAQTECG